MEKSAERAAKVGEVRRLVCEGATLDAALLAAGVSETTYRRWAAKFDKGGVGALADAPKSGRPPAVTLDEDEKKCLRRIYLQSNRAERAGSMTMAARIAAHDPATCLRPETRAAILAERSSKHHLPVEVRRAMREVSGVVTARYRDPREGQNNGIYVPGWLRRDEETGRLLLPGDKRRQLLVVIQERFHCLEVIYVPRVLRVRFRRPCSCGFKYGFPQFFGKVGLLFSHVFHLRLDIR